MQSVSRHPCPSRMCSKTGKQHEDVPTCRIPLTARVRAASAQSDCNGPATHPRQHSCSMLSVCCNACAQLLALGEYMYMVSGS